MDKLLFTGNESMTVDSKGRVGIPARFMATLRAICPDQLDAVGVMISPDSSIKIMPVPYYDKEFERLNQLNDQMEEDRQILNIMFSFAELAPLDKQNRIKLSPLLMAKCSIKRDVVIIGSRQYLQLFDEKLWSEYCKQALPLLGSATSQVARRTETPSPVQYVINAGATPAPPPARTVQDR